MVFSSATIVLDYIFDLEKHHNNKQKTLRTRIKKIFRAALGKSEFRKYRKLLKGLKDLALLELLKRVKIYINKTN